jgi:hypothetical protein
MLAARRLSSEFAKEYICFSADRYFFIFSPATLLRRSALASHSKPRSSSRTIAAIGSRFHGPSNPAASSGCGRSLAIFFSSAAASLFGRRFDRTSSSRSTICRGPSNRPISPGTSISKASSSALTISTASRLLLSRGFLSLRIPRRQELSPIAAPTPG